MAEGGEEEGWVYLDDAGTERGPFTLLQMLTWWNSGMLRSDLKVKRQKEEEFAVISNRPEFNPHYYLHSQGGSPAQAQAGVGGEGAIPGAADASGMNPPQPHSGDYAMAQQPLPSDPDKELAARLMAQERYTQLGTFNARTGR